MTQLPTHTITFLFTDIGGGREVVNGRVDCIRDKGKLGGFDFLRLNHRVFKNNPSILALDIALPVD